MVKQNKHPVGLIEDLSMLSSEEVLIQEVFLDAGVFA